MTVPFSLISGLSFSQSSADFSGKWTLDISKSSSAFANTYSTINITQVDNKIDLEISQNQIDAKPPVKTINYLIGASIASASPFKNNPNHKETTITMEWGPNKQSFIIKEVTSVFVEKEIPKESTNIKVYSLIDGGKKMIIKSDDTLPEGSITPESERHTAMVPGLFRFPGFYKKHIINQS
jgi:uncharacterized protein YqgV (UPF0045/DUF77 family)